MFIGLLVLLPVAFLPVPWATLPHAKVGLLVIFTGIGIVAFVLARFLEGNLSLPKSWVVFAAILLPVAYLISAVATGASRSSLLGGGIEPHTVAIMFLWAAVVILGAMVFRGRAELLRMQYAFLIGSGLVLLFQFARLFFPDALTFGGSFTSPSASIVGSWHDLGIFLGLAAFFAAAILGNPAHSMSERTRWLLRILVLASIVMLVIVNTFDVWVGLGILSVLSLAYLTIRWIRVADPMQTTGTFSFNVLPFIALAVVSILFAVYGTQIHNMLPQRLNIAYVEVRPSWVGTFAVASQTLEGKNALFGSGPNTFIRQWGLYKPVGVNETAFWNADFTQGVGFIPTSIVTVGLLAALAWILFLLSIVYESVAALLQRSLEVQPFVAVLVGAIAYLWVLSTVYSPGITLLTFAFLFTGALVGWGMYAGSMPSYQRLISETPRFGFVWSVFLIVIALSTCIVSAIMIRTLISDMYVNRSIVIYNQTQNIQTAQGSLDTALKIDSGNDRANRAALELGILQIASLAASTSPDVEKLRAELSTTVSAAIQHGLTAVAQDGGNYQNWFSLARVYEQLVGAQVQGAYENAEKAYQSAIKANPTNPLPYFRLAQLAVAKNDLQGSENYLRQALALKPNFAEALFMLAQLEYAKGNYDAAFAALQATVLAVPQEPVAWFQLGTLLYQGGTYQDAAIALKQAVALNSNYANAIYMLGLTDAALGKKDDALVSFKKVLELNPGNAQVEAAINTLENPPATTTPATTKKQK